MIKKALKKGYIAEEFQQKRLKKANVIKNISHVVTSQAISESGRYLFVGNLAGEIFIHDSLEFNQLLVQPTNLIIYNVQMKVLCLHFYIDCLIVGSKGGLFALKWNEEFEQLKPQYQWMIKLKAHELAFSPPDVNCMWQRENSTLLYVGCDDFMIYEIDMATQAILREYVGHEGLIHDLIGTEEGRLFSASEDGTVRCWEENLQKQWGCITPSNFTELAREDFGKFIGAVSVSGKFVIAGGGPKAAIFHLDTFTAGEKYEFPGSVHVTKMIDDTVFIAGEHNRLQKYCLTGTKYADMPVDLPCIYSLVYQQFPYNYMSVAGCSNELHIIRDNFQFIDFKIELYNGDQPSHIINNYDP